MINVSKILSEVYISHVIIHLYVFKQLILQNKRWISYEQHDERFAYYFILSNQQDIRTADMSSNTFQIGQLIILKLLILRTNLTT